MYPKCSKSVRRPSHLSNFRCQWRSMNCRAWLQNRRSDPHSTAIVFQCIQCQFAAECFVQQAASPSFAWRQSFDCSAFTTPLAVPTSTVFDLSFGPKYLPCSNRWMAAEASTTLAHRTVPRGNSAPSHISFIRCLAVSTHRKPTVHAGCIRHKPLQQIMACWHFGTRS